MRDRERQLDMQPATGTAWQPFHLTRAATWPSSRPATSAHAGSLLPGAPWDHLHQGMAQRPRGAAPRGSARPQQHPGHPGAAEGPAGGGLQSGAEGRGRRQEAARSFWRPAAGGRGLAAALGPAPWGGPGVGSRLGGWADTQPPAEQFPIKFWLPAAQVPAPCFYLPLKAVPGLGWTFWCFPSTWDELIPTPLSAVLRDCTAIPPWALAGHAAAGKAALHCPLSASNTPCANALFLSPNLYSSAPHTGCSKQTTWKQD